MTRPRLSRRRTNPSRKQRRFRSRLAAYRHFRKGRPRRRIPRAAVPSFFTLMNLFCGFIALTQTLEGNYTGACWLIVLAGFFDALDGMMARLTNGTSLFGVELDSLSDIVSFGVAPGFLVYVYSLQDYGNLGLIVSSLPAICGAVRLARFNVEFDGEKKPYFLGLPIPMQAIAIVALILNINDVSFLYEFSVNDYPITMPIVFVLAALMISNIRFDAVPKPSARYIREHIPKSIAYGIGLLLLVFLQQIGLLIVLSVYLLHGIGYSLYLLIKRVMSLPPAPEGND